jgi:hypothetical protein
MPWSNGDAPKHTKKADTPAEQKKWVDTANAVRKKTGNDAKAIRIANAAIKKK